MYHSFYWAAGHTRPPAIFSPLYIYRPVAVIMKQEAEIFMKSNKNVSLLASMGLLLTAVIWGFAFVVVKDSLDTIPPIYMMAFRFTIASAALTLIFAKRLFHLDRALLKSGLVLGVLLFLSYAAQTIGCKYTTAGKNAFLTTVYVVIVPLLHWVINRQKTDKIHVAAAVLAIFGIGLLSLQGDFTIGIGDLLSLLCGFGYAAHMIFIDRYTTTQDPVTLTVLQLSVSAVLSWLIAPFADGAFPMGAFEPGAIVSMLYLGLLSTMLAFLLQNVCQKYTHPSTAAILLSMESVFGVLFAMIFLGEWLTPRMAVGCVLIFIAILLAQTRFEFAKRFLIAKKKSV